MTEAKSMKLDKGIMNDLRATRYYSKKRDLLGDRLCALGRLEHGGFTPIGSCMR